MRVTSNLSIQHLNRLICAVQAELDRFIELLFRDSEAYRLALKLYAGRYEVIAAREAADILREVIEKHMPDSDRQAPSEDDETDGQAGD
jgi:chromosome segregation and condensation protein ScpB